MSTTTSTFSLIDAYTYTKKNLGISSLPGVILITYLSAQPLFTLAICIGITLLGIIASQVMLKYNHNIDKYLMPLRILLVVSLFFVAGPQSPVWLLGIIGLTATTLVITGWKSKIAAVIILITLVASCNYLSGVALQANIIAVFALSSFAIILLSLTKFLSQINRKLAQQKTEIEAEREKADLLLQNILPISIAEQLKTNKKDTVKRFEHTSILFADLVNFTLLSEKLAPQQLVEILNGLFSKFDDLTDKYGLEKIKTIGDAYMVAAGVPEEKTNHAQSLFLFAQEMLVATKVFNEANGLELSLRIGMNSGPLIAGVIGKKKFSYDLWGDTVNTAARMEAYGQQDCIQVSSATYAILKKDFDFEQIPDVEIKGKGLMDVYLWPPFTG